MRRCLCLVVLVLAFWVVMSACDSRDTVSNVSADVESPAPTVPAPAPSPQPTPAPAPVPLAQTGGALPDFTSLVDDVAPSVVNIYTKTIVRERPRSLNPFFPRAPQDRLSESLGTGFIIDARGLIATNNHVIDKAAQIQVRTNDGREYQAKIVGKDPRTDIALLQLINAPTMKPLRFGDSDKVRVGEWVLAIGNALGLSSTVTKGIISAKGRSDVPIGGSVRYVDFLQTDASINPGNSGGPLINMKGEVIGINTAIRADGQGIGFAIPINMAKEILPHLRNDGKVSRSWLGIYVDPVTPQNAPPLGLREEKGAIVSRVISGGPAERAGLRRGDVIVGFNGEPVDSISDLRWKSSLAGVGKTVQIKVIRNRKPLALSMKLTRNPHE